MADHRKCSFIFIYKELGSASKEELVNKLTKLELSYNRRKTCPIERIIVAEQKKNKDLFCWIKLEVKGNLEKYTEQLTFENVTPTQRILRVNHLNSIIKRVAENKLLNPYCWPADVSALLKPKEEKDVLPLRDKLKKTKKQLQHNSSETAPDYFFNDNFSANGKHITFEDRYNEFKDYKGPILRNDHWDCLRSTICGFLNSEGGNLYLGITDEGTVKGIEMGQKEFDEFKLTFAAEINGRITPKMPPDLISIKPAFCFADRLEADRFYSGPGEKVKVTHVVIFISVQKPEKTVYFVREGNGLVCFQRYDAYTKLLDGNGINQLMRTVMRCSKLHKYN